mmetsp:Transcript_27007/g.43496  ORF Transcript_27007/g.43496 Transcript_27007/m.43496 type:complete len:130 (+) Transcript_27007:23-412(+)
MSWMKLAAILVSVSVCLGCTYIPRDDQEDYCYSDLAYEATIKSRNIGEITADYELEISRVYKGTADDMPTELQGIGTLNSCGPTELDVGAKYLIYASTAYSDRPYIVKYTAIADVTDSDRTKIEGYECK